MCGVEKMNLKKQSGIDDIYGDNIFYYKLQHSEN